MITSNELRIGNWVYSLLKVPVQVPLIVGTDLNWNPIPLTPEILHAAGFRSGFTSDPQERPASKHFEVDWLDLHQHNEEENNFYWYNGEEERQIYSLHQLQNLYFALTGTELNVQL